MTDHKTTDLSYIGLLQGIVEVKRVIAKSSDTIIDV